MIISNLKFDIDDSIGNYAMDLSRKWAGCFKSLFSAVYAVFAEIPINIVKYPCLFLDWMIDKALEIISLAKLFAIVAYEIGLNILTLGAFGFTISLREEDRCHYGHVLNFLDDYFETVKNANTAAKMMAYAFNLFVFSIAMLPSALIDFVLQVTVELISLLTHTLLISIPVAVSTTLALPIFAVDAIEGCCGGEADYGSDDRFEIG